jgi:transcriptional regulator with XRE-family HTH domain
MISLLERGESTASATVLQRLAAALGLTLSALFEPPEGSVAPSGPVARAAEQPVWKDPGSGYRRRNVSPSSASPLLQIVEVSFPPGARVAFDNGGQLASVHQQVWLLRGRMDVTVGRRRHRLDAGDCLAMQLDQPTMFHNPTRKAARYAVVIAQGAGGGAR